MKNSQPGAPRGPPWLLHQLRRCRPKATSNEYWPNPRRQRRGKSEARKATHEQGQGARTQSQGSETRTHTPTQGRQTHTNTHSQGSEAKKAKKGARRGTHRNTHSQGARTHNTQGSEKRQEEATHTRTRGNITVREEDKPVSSRSVKTFYGAFATLSQTAMYTVEAHFSYLDYCLEKTDLYYMSRAILDRHF